MDSCNSGSLQSSSNGEDEFDSRAAVNFSSFMNTQPSNPLPGYFFNQNTQWNRPVTPRSDPNSFINTLIPSFQQTPLIAPENNNNNLTAVQNQNQTAARNPKKRSRASRRAPTTVLTTDTSNFRAMVQEFTGIPNPPFNTSPYQRTRLDLFTGKSNFTDAPPYLLRPFAQKAQPFLAASSSGTNSISSSSNDIPISQSLNPFNISANPFLQQSNTKFPFCDSSSLDLGSKNQFSDHLNSMKFGDFSLGRHGNLISSSVINQPIVSTYPGGAPQRIATSNMQNDVLLENNNGSNNVGTWRNNPVREEVSVPNDTQPVNGNFEFSTNMNTMMASFNTKVLENNNNIISSNNNGVGMRSEGMVESWINCTNSD